MTKGIPRLHTSHTLLDQWCHNYANFIRSTVTNRKLSKDTDSVVILKEISLKRKLVIMPVQINESSEIKVGKKRLSPAEKHAYNEITNRLSSEQSLRSYLSSLAFKLRDDNLFAEWNILHVHLGLINPTTGNANRTSKTLDLSVVDDQAYMITFSGHGKMNYTNPHFFEIIDNNWPDSNILMYLKGITGKRNLSDKERTEFRKKGINSAVFVHGKALMASMNAMNMAGTSLVDLEIFNNRIKPFFKQTEKIFYACLKNSSNNKREKVSLGALVRNNNIYIININMPGTKYATLNLDDFWKAILLPKGPTQLHWKVWREFIDTIKFFKECEQSFNCHYSL